MTLRLEFLKRKSYVLAVRLGLYIVDASQVHADLNPVDQGRCDPDRSELDCGMRVTCHGVSYY